MLNLGIDIFSVPSGGGGPAPPPPPPIEPWVRPEDWLEFTDPAPGSQEVQILMAVYPTSNNFAVVRCQGAFTVDWGDGSSPEDVASNTAGRKAIAYADAPAGTETSGGYRQVIIKVTPQVGQDITFFAASDAVYLGANAATSTNYLDIVLSLPEVTSLQISRTNPACKHAMLEQIRFLNIDKWVNISDGCRDLAHLRRVQFPASTPQVTNMTRLFRGCSSLQEIVGLSTENVTTMLETFYFCGIPGSALPATWDTGNNASFSSTFRNMPLLGQLPNWDFSKATSIVNMCNASFIRVLDKQFPEVLNATSAFSGSSLEEIQILDLPKATNTTGIFEECRALVKVVEVKPLDAATDSVSNMFLNCTALQEFPSISMPALSSTAIVGPSQVFAGLSVATRMGVINLGNASRAPSLFANMGTVREIEDVICSNSLTNAATVFQNCQSLRVIPAGLDLSGATTVTNLFTGCRSVERILCVPPKVSFSVAQTIMGKDGLEELFTNLDTVITSPTLTITGTPGAATADKTIAEDKGWTVSG